ncbi:unnamed protein product [Caenorhabditis sp. 36 PRJEB53466]|nr:unnamed protein product [Caenorhabditis sp. 36 PRJEB53466]
MNAGLKYKNSSYYIMVYNDCTGYGRHSFYAPNGAGKHSFRRGGCNVYVYWSSDWNKASQAARDRFTQQARTFGNKGLPVKCDESFWSGPDLNYSGYPKHVLDNELTNAGFVGMIRDDQGLTLRVSACVTPTPGYHTEMTLGIPNSNNPNVFGLPGRYEKFRGTKYMMIFGYY